jgi:hypothetical protein
MKATDAAKPNGKHRRWARVLCSDLSGTSRLCSPLIQTVTQGIFLDASRALASLGSASESGMLTLTVLHPSGTRTFKIEDFITGKTPAPEDILLEQRLVSVSRAHERE